MSARRSRWFKWSLLEVRVAALVDMRSPDLAGLCIPERERRRRGAIIPPMFGGCDETVVDCAFKAAEGVMRSGDDEDRGIAAML